MPWAAVHHAGGGIAMKLVQGGGSVTSGRWTTARTSCRGGGATLTLGRDHWGRGAVLAGADCGNFGWSVMNDCKSRITRNLEFLVSPTQVLTGSVPA